jgi:hypothetical protein
VGWGHPKYSVFFQRIGKCRATQYTTLWHRSDAKTRKANSSTFAMYFDEIQEKVVETWRIPPEVVEEHKHIANFQVSRHNVWIQEKRDPKKNWLQMRYCVTGEEVQWAMKDWPDEWKVPVTSKKETKGKKIVEVGTSQKSNSPTTNTRKVAEHTKETGGSMTVENQDKRTFPQCRRRTTQVRSKEWKDTNGG